MKTLAEVVPKVLTETLEPTTKTAKPITTYVSLSRVGTFQTLNDPTLERMWAAAEAFAADVNNRAPYWITFCGPSGTGKTHLARMLFRHFMGASRFNVDIDVARQRIIGNTGQFCKWRNLAGELKAGGYDAIEDLIEDSFVVLDDVGAAHDPSSFIASALDQIIAGRGRKWTVVTCNYSLGEIARRMDERIASRLIRDGNVVIECNTTDFNLR